MVFDLFRCTKRLQFLLSFQGIFNTVVYAMGHYKTLTLVSNNYPLGVNYWCLEPSGKGVTVFVFLLWRPSWFANPRIDYRIWALDCRVAVEKAGSCAVHMHLQGWGSGVGGAVGRWEWWDWPYPRVHLPCQRISAIWEAFCAGYSHRFLLLSLFPLTWPFWCKAESDLKSPSPGAVPPEGAEHVYLTL